MKKTLSLVLAACMALSLCACGGGSTANISFPTQSTHPAIGRASGRERE